MSEKEFTSIQKYMLDIAGRYGNDIKPLVDIANEALSALGQQSIALKNYLKAAQEKRMSGDIATELYLTMRSGFLTFEKCSRIAEQELKND